MLSISNGMHWIAAFNDGGRVWFVDAQTGKGFNLYDDIEPNPDSLCRDESMQIVRVSVDYFDQYAKTESWASKLML